MNVSHGLVVVSYQIATEKIGKSELQGTTKFVTAQRVLDMFHPVGGKQLSSIILLSTQQADLLSLHAEPVTNTQSELQASEVRRLRSMSTDRLPLLHRIAS